MINEVVYLRDEDKSVTLETYVATDIDHGKRSAVLVFPGGGYHMCAHHEGEKIALQYFAAGINAFVLKYSVKGNNPDMKYPMPQVDASNAMKYIKDNAERFNIDKDKVFVLGFSAGGHLASTMGTIWHRPEIYENAQPMEYGYNKPAGMILCYPVISYSDFGHKGSFHNLCGAGLPEEEYKKYSSELNVDDRTCPAFLWHTSTDNAVPVENSLVMGLALKKQGIQFEMHIYPEGNHGLGLPNENVTDIAKMHISEWMENSIKWVKSF